MAACSLERMSRCQGRSDTRVGIRTSSVPALIDENGSRFGVEPIYRVLGEHGCGIAPNTYWCAEQRPPSARASRDVELVARVQRLLEENFFVSGAGT